MAKPNRGEIWLVDLGYAAKIRPSLVLSIPANDWNDRALVTLIPHTTSTRGSRFEINIDLKFLKVGAFDVQNVVTIPHVKLTKRLGVLSNEQIGAIEAALRIWLGLE